MIALQTPSEGENHDLICPICSKLLDHLLKQAREIATYLEAHFKRVH